MEDVLHLDLISLRVQHTPKQKLPKYIRGQLLLGTIYKQPRVPPVTSEVVNTQKKRYIKYLILKENPLFHFLGSLLPNSLANKAHLQACYEIQPATVFYLHANSPPQGSVDAFQKAPLGRKAKRKKKSHTSSSLVSSFGYSTVLPSVKCLEHLLHILCLVSQLLMAEDKCGTFTQSQPEAEVSRLYLL